METLRYAMAWRSWLTTRLSEGMSAAFRNSLIKGFRACRTSFKSSFREKVPNPLPVAGVPSGVSAVSKKVKLVLVSSAELPAKLKSYPFDPLLRLYELTLADACVI
jgi:hypothetical protein